MSLVVKTLATSDGVTKLASDKRWTPWCWAWKAKCHWHAARRTLPGPSVSLARRMLGDLARVFFDSDCFYNGILETCSFGWFIWFFSGVSHYVSVCGEVSHCPFLHTSFSHPDRATELGQETDCSTEDCRGLFFVDFHSCYLPVLDTCTQLHKLHCNDMMDMDRNE